MNGDSGHPTKGYGELLGDLAIMHPLLADALRKAEENRAANLNFYLRGARLDGLEELHAHLTEIGQALAATESGRKIAFLVDRAQAGFHTALEATLSGYVSLAHDAMRDVMEIEFLLRDFAAEPDNLDAWLAADAKTLSDRFRANHLRQRDARRLGKRPEDLGEHSDYRAHSLALHVMPWPSPFSSKGFVSPDVAFGIDMAFWELFEHGRRLVLAVRQLLQTAQFTGVETREPDTDLPQFKKAWELTQDMVAFFRALLNRQTRGRDEDV